MPEHEFEIYLSLLSRLLRLSPAQKASISDELRDHLEERLTHLLQSGMSREAAIQKAMEEFGDVTGLALDLTKVSRTPLRKVVVRSTIAASVTAAAIVCWITLFVPEHRIAAPPAVQAQQDQPAKAAGQPATNQNPEKPRATLRPLVLNDEELFPAFLAKRTDVINLVDVPLKEVCEFLSSLHDIPVMLHRLALEEDGRTADTPINLNLTGLSLEEVLNHLTRQLNLAWQVDGGVIRITTPAAARYLTRHFDLRKLTKLGHSLDALVDILRRAADEWEDQGGGTTALIGESVIVRQTYQHQRRIAQVLAAIEQQQPMTVLGTCTARDRLLEALHEPSEASFVETPLIEAMAYLSERHNIPILIDGPAIAEDGLGTDQPVTLSIKNRPLEQLLELLLGDHPLTYQVRDGVIRITTKSKASADMLWIVYNVQDLAPTEELFTQLSAAILHTTDGQWRDVSGENGDLVPTDVGGRLVVKQTDQVHFGIQALLEQLRRSRQDRVVNADKSVPHPKMVTKSYRMPKEIALDLHTALKNLVAPASWKPVNDEVPMIELVASSPQMDQVDGWVSGGSHEIQVINPPKEAPKAGAASPETHAVKSVVIRPRSILVIRQTPEVHREIQQFLSNLGVVVELGVLEPGSRGHWLRGGMGGMFGGGMGGGMGGMGGGGGGFF